MSVDAATGASLPQFVKDEFDALLVCGILAHGFLRLRCADCGRDKLVAFSCRRCGFCPSCGARRIAQTTAHLVDHVIPRVPVRQWVLSLPIPLRLLRAAQPKLVTPVLQVVRRAIARFLLQQAGLKVDQADSGAVTLIQRFGSAGNLNAGATLPLHHAPGVGQRTRAMQWRRSGRAQAQDCLARRHHAYRDVAAEVHAAARGAGPTTGACT